MKSTFKILFYLKRDKIKKNGKMPIFCRITVDGSASRFNLKIEISPDSWNADFARATGKSKEAVDTNQILESTSASLHAVYRKILEKDNYVTAEKVKNSYLGLSTDSTTLLQLYQQHNDDMEKSVGITVAKATLQKYKVTYKRLEEFMKSRYNISDISLKEIDHRFVTEFEFFLRTDSLCNVNTTYKYMRFFKKIIIMARNNGWILTDPFGNYKIRYEKVDRGYLTDTELLAMINKDFGTERLEQVRDIFIFSCYSGLAYVDVHKLTHDDIREGFDKNLWIMTKREKTNISVNVPLLDIPKAIIDKYKGKMPNNKVLPVISNQKMNAYLKEIAAICKIEKNLTFHCGRHTFGTYLVNKGVPYETVARTMEHSNTRMTKHYAKMLGKTVVNDIVTHVINSNKMNK